MSVHALDQRIGLILAAATMASMALVAAAVAAMALTGVDPLTRPYPAPNWGGLWPDVVALRSEGLLWLGLSAVILTPAVRVGASLVGFAAARDRRQAAMALAVLAIMFVGVVLGHGG